MVFADAVYAIIVTTNFEGYVVSIEEVRFPGGAGQINTETFNSFGRYATSSGLVVRTHGDIDFYWSGDTNELGNAGCDITVYLPRSDVANDKVMVAVLGPPWTEVPLLTYDDDAQSDGMLRILGYFDGVDEAPAIFIGSGMSADPPNPPEAFWTAFVQARETP